MAERVGIDCCIEPHYMKDCLSKIDAKRVNLHGMPPIYRLYLRVGEAADHAISWVLVPQYCSED